MGSSLHPAIVQIVYPYLKWTRLPHSIDCNILHTCWFCDKYKSASSIFIYDQNHEEENSFRQKKITTQLCKWAIHEHLTLPCYYFACGGLEDRHHTNELVVILNLMVINLVSRYNKI